MLQGADSGALLVWAPSTRVTFDSGGASCFLSLWFDRYRASNPQRFNRSFKQ
jgi:hypothetical protein